MSTTSTPKLLRSAPYLPVPDVRVASSHYTNVLGFVQDYVGGDPPEFAIVSRDGLAVMLRQTAGAEAIVPNEAQGGTWDVFFWVSNLQALHEELVASGADVVYPPTVQEAYGMEEFAVRDLDGYVLGFGEVLALRDTAEEQAL